MTAADARLLTRSTAARTPATDRIFGAASQAANRSMLWLVTGKVRNGPESWTSSNPACRRQAASPTL